MQCSITLSLKALGRPTISLTAVLVPAPTREHVHDVSCCRDKGEGVIPFSRERRGVREIERSRNQERLRGFRLAKQLQGRLTLLRRPIKRRTTDVRDCVDSEV
jgi:hypothetical protein